MTSIPISVDGGLVVQVLDHIAPAPAAAAKGGQLHGAGSALDAACREAWTRLRELVEHSARAGWDAVCDEVRAFAGFVEQSAAELGRQAQALRAFVLSKVRDAIDGIVDALLALLRSELAIGGRRYLLDEVRIESRLTMTGEVEAAVTSLCKLAGEGEITVGGQYRLDSASGA